MPTALDVASDLSARCDGIAAAFRDARDAFGNGHLAPATFHAVTELSALNLHSQVETLLEEVFLSCLMGESGVDVEPLVSPASREHAKDLISLNAGRGEYLNWLPIAVVTQRARVMFRFGRPFSRLEYRPSIAAGLKELVIVRNAVAHPSQVAARKFAELAAAKGYGSSRPADLLLSVREGASELEHQIALVRAIALGIAEASEADVEPILGPERHFDSGERGVPPGDYSCVECRASVQLADGGDLHLCPCMANPAGPCATCGQVAPCATCSKARSRVTRYVRTPT